MNRLHLPTRDSAVGRAMATAVQVLLGAITMLPLFAAFISDPRLTGLVHDYLPQAAGLVATAGGLVTLLNNLLRSEVPNY